MRLTRRGLIAGAAGTALGAAGVYELVERMGSAPARTVAAGPLPPEQHVLEGIRVITDNGVEVNVPPLHHQLVTLRLAGGHSRADLRDAQTELRSRLEQLEAEYPNTPAGLGVTVGWGLPYFQGPVAGPAATHLPIDRRATAASADGKPVPVLIDAIRFPSDPAATVLERNDAVLLLRSDSQAHIADAAKRLVDELDGVWTKTSIRRGFVGGGFDGGQGLPKRMAVAAGITGAELIPDGAQLFLGFTSTQKAALGPTRIANLETLGYSDGGPGGYFRQGTSMHVSHIFEDVEQWYLAFGEQQRIASAFRPGKQVPDGTLTVRQGPKDVATVDDNLQDYANRGAIGHSASLQPVTRLAEAVTGSDGTHYAKGTAIPQRADFNTLDNPFFWSADPDADGMSGGAAAGLHFVVFNPTADDFRRNRLAMDGALPGQRPLHFTPPDPGQGFNAVLKTTHRQNFLVPPRRNRSFPLAELL